MKISLLLSLLAAASTPDYSVIEQGTFACSDESALIHFQDLSQKNQSINHIMGNGCFVMDRPIRAVKVSHTEKSVCYRLLRARMGSLSSFCVHPISVRE